MSSKKLFIFGLGYSASRAARVFQSAGYLISGTVRSVNSASQLSQVDAELFRFDQSDSSPQNVYVFDGESWSDSNLFSLELALKGVTHVLISVPTGRIDGKEDPVLSSLGDLLISAIKDSVQWVGYLSTIGVYGETNGEIVNESAPVKSLVKRSQMRIKAEQLWLESGLPVHIFRIAGIYGPGRGIIPKVRSGMATRIHIPNRKFNRIHADDIINILLASAAQPNPGAIYNVCDDEPAPADEVTAYACELLGVSMPPLQSWEKAEKDMSPMVKSFYAESKLCANQRIKRELGVKLLYPTYRYGLLAQVLEEEKLVKNELKAPIKSLFASSDSIPRMIVLINTGSLRAESYANMRHISFQLSRALRQLVVPCGFGLSDQVNTREHNGLRAKTLEMVVAEHLALHNNCASEIIVLPLFLGPSVIMRDYMPNIFDKVWAARPSASLSVRVGDCLVKSCDDTRVAEMLLERSSQVVNFTTVKENVTILVVYPDTLSREASGEIDMVAQQLRRLLKTNQHIKLAGSACIESQKGASHDSSDPPLAEALEYYSVSEGIVVFAKSFFSDDCIEKNIEEIIQCVRAGHPDLDLRVAEALGPNELLSSILSDRYDSAVSKDTPDYSLCGSK
ncbi:with nad-binding rossmann-fold domain [Plasmopara halstedii]|uniref:With nad-binding rossmann-fold domain n=1 Tax=Plasmopara halstedii TaxID=4781 RepID=A0A0P1A8S2_PLAHL|nr:with nad-binding rossmann-fold domain [Plasmopara halstedii]CEG37110.1 with nad-binding rossmann-fold domain [Plasmopara halstedii]|eukprot:XP_024573479.1 with nad-binding rossmann-fold domain [Plasmopara halstedii]